MENPPEIIATQQKLILGEMQVLCGMGELFNHVDHGLPMWSGEGSRTVVVKIDFQEPFAAPPLVTLGVSGIDSAHDKNLRLWLTARNLSTNGFTIECNTWADTNIARAAVSWQAIGPAAKVEPKTRSS